MGVPRLIFSLAVCSGTLGAVSWAADSESVSDKKLVLPKNYVQGVTRGQIENPTRIPPEPRVSASAPLLTPTRAVISDVYHNGLLHLAQVSSRQMRGCRLQFKPIPPGWLPGFGPIFHVEAVFDFDAKNPVRLVKQGVQRDSQGSGKPATVASDRTERLVFSAEVEVVTPNPLVSTGILPVRYPMIYRAVSKEQFVQENFPDPQTRLGLFSREIGHESKSQDEVCWRYLVQLLGEADITRKEQLRRAAGDERSARYPYLALGTNCVSLAIGNLVASQGRVPQRLPSLPATAMDKTDFLELGLTLGPKTPVHLVDWDVAFKATAAPDSQSHLPSETK
jgi:hypothetical protein